MSSDVALPDSSMQLVPPEVVTTQLTVWPFPLEGPVISKVIFVTDSPGLNEIVTGNVTVVAAFALDGAVIVTIAADTGPLDTIKAERKIVNITGMILSSFKIPFAVL